MWSLRCRYFTALGSVVVGAVVGLIPVFSAGSVLFWFCLNLKELHNIHLLSIVKVTLHDAICYV